MKVYLFRKPAVLVLVAGLFIAAIFPIPSVFAVSSRQTADAGRLDAYIETQMADYDIPGLVVAIVRGQEVEFIKGYGVADDTGRAMTPSTPFLIASLSKSITALAVMQLVEEEKIDLDAPVRTYLPWFETADKDASSKITVRHLLHQTTGFSERESYRRNLDANPSDDALELSIHNLRTTRLNFPPGTAFEYANTNYDILGLIIQTVSGQSYESYIEENVFSPLRMTNSYTTLEQARGANLASGYFSYFGSTTAIDARMPYSRTTKPSAGLFSSAEDLSHYLIAQLNGGIYQDAVILSPQGIAALHTPGILYSQNAGYAMGWASFPFTDLQPAAQDGVVPVGIAHRGVWIGYYSMMVLIPELDTGIVILMNKSDPAQEPALFNIGWSLCMLAAGLDPLEAGTVGFLGENIVLILIVVNGLLVLGLVWALRRLRQPSTPAGMNAQQERSLVVPMALLAVLDLILAGALLFVHLPDTKDTLALALRFTPDVGILYLVLLFLTLGWGTLRTIWFLRKYQSAR